MKSLLVDLSIWQWLNDVKTKHNFRSVGDVLNVMIKHCEESIKRGDLEFKTQ